MAARVKIKPGDDISWAGVITTEGVTDFTGYTLTSEIRDIDQVTGVFTTLLASPTISWLAPTAGAFLLVVPRAVTENWPVGRCLALDIRIATPAGEHFRTETAVFETVAGVTA